jgi:GNAT superfamily N-acetyltransferase
MPEVILMRESEIESAGAVLARAFFRDPIVKYMLPDESERERLSPWHFTAFVRYGYLFGEVYVAIDDGTGDVTGVAVWFPPGSIEMPPERVAQAGLDKAPEVLGADVWNRFMTVIDKLDQTHHEDMKTRHWFLPLLGIDPLHQGSGLGGKMIKPVLAHADAQGLPCYLATVQPRNVRFYQKQGFTVVSEDVEAVSGIRFWTFRRDPT